LRTLIRTALQENYDLRIAASRILEAKAQLGITRADQFPTVSAGAGIADVRTAQSKFLPAFETSTGQVNASAAWELDFWGKFRRATEAARANLLASEWARQEVVSTLVANVAAAYLQLRALDLELEISKRTLDSRQESLRLTQILANGGATSLLDVRQAEQLVFTASAEIPAPEQQIEQQENSAFCSARTPATYPEGRLSSSNDNPLKCRQGFRHLCWGAGPIFARRKKNSLRQMRKSAWRVRRIFLRFRSAGAEDSRVLRSPICSVDRRARGVLALLWRSRFLQEAGSARECVWPRPNSKRPRCFTNNRFREPFVVSPMPWSRTAGRGNSARSKNCSSSPQRTPRVFPTCAIRAAPRVISKY
jgi:Outer membrane efflux protein